MLDAPGHGTVGQLEADLWGSARLAVEMGGPATYLGYSMGGRVALHAALAAPHIVRRLVVLGVTAGIEDENERSGRRRTDEDLADRIEVIGIESFLDEWLSGPLFERLSPETACRAERAVNSPTGLASSLRSVGVGTQQPLWSRLGQLDMPVLVLAGATDEKFAELGRRIASCIGDNAAFQTIDGAGHAAHLERPGETAAVVTEWLASTPPDTGQRPKLT
jgi:2-succinyl-6-hydroxy-2,4-cyclohexadiene-1-carboxylate synthase